MTLPTNRGPAPSYVPPAIEKAPNGVATLKRTILIVEDDEFLLQLLRMVFESDGYRAVGARNGNDALAQMERERPHAVLLDVCLPEKDGWSVVRAMREDLRTAGIPVVMMAAARERLAVPAGHPRPEAFVAKPFSLRDVVRTVRLFADGPRREGPAPVLEASA